MKRLIFPSILILLLAGWTGGVVGWELAKREYEDVKGLEWNGSAKVVFKDGITHDCKKITFDPYLPMDTHLDGHPIEVVCKYTDDPGGIAFRLREAQNINLMSR